MYIPSCATSRYTPSATAFAIHQRAHHIRKPVLLGVPSRTACCGIRSATVFSIHQRAHHIRKAMFDHAPACAAFCDIRLAMVFSIHQRAQRIRNTMVDHVPACTALRDVWCATVLAIHQRAHTMRTWPSQIAQRAQRFQKRLFCLRRRAQWMSAILEMSAIRMCRRASCNVCDNRPMSALTPLTVLISCPARFVDISRPSCLGRLLMIKYFLGC